MERHLGAPPPRNFASNLIIFLCLPLEIFLQTRM
jgi:hypothetical protein